MHLALASDPDDPAFAPEPLTEAELSALSDRLKEQVRVSLARSRTRSDSLPEDVRPLATELLTARPRLLELVAAGPSAATGWSRSGSTATTTSASSSGKRTTSSSSTSRASPAGPVEERRAKQSPLKDVAGMLRSFDYAAVHVPATRPPRSTPTPSNGSSPGRGSGGPGCRPSSSRRIARSPPSSCPADPAAARQLLDFLRLEKALFELRYELDYRPDWVRIPLLGILHLIRSRDRRMSRCHRGREPMLETPSRSELRELARSYGVQRRLSWT